MTSNYSKSYKKQYGSIHYQTHREEILLKRRQDYESNKEFYRERLRTWRKNHPDRLLIYKKRDEERRIERTYNLSAKEYKEIIKRQKSKCLICNKKCAKLHVDHDHITGKVRGMLCLNCNNGLGKLGDNYESVLNALNYLKNVG